LCAQHHVDANTIRPADLAVHRPALRKPRRQLYKMEEKQEETEKETPDETEKEKEAEAEEVKKKTESVEAKVSSPPFGFGMSWEELMSSTPSWECGPKWVGPASFLPEEEKDEETDEKDEGGGHGHGRTSGPVRGLVPGVLSPARRPRVCDSAAVGSFAGRLAR